MPHTVRAARLGGPRDVTGFPGETLFVVPLGERWKVQTLVIVNFGITPNPAARVALAAGTPDAVVWQGILGGANTAILLQDLVVVEPGESLIVSLVNALDRAIFTASGFKLALT